MATVLFHTRDLSCIVKLHSTNSALKGQDCLFGEQCISCGCIFTVFFIVSAMNGMSFVLISLSVFSVKVMILEESLRRLKRIILKKGILWI